MNAPFNPYAAWLGLPVSSRSPSHYELLGLSPSESSAEAIAQAADAAISKVRAIRPGANASAWAQLLDELAGAKAVLLDPNQKAAYDSQRASAMSGAVAGQPPSAAPANPGAATPPSNASAPSTPATGSLEMAVEVTQPSQAEAAAKYPPGFQPPATVTAPNTPAANAPAGSAPSATPSGQAAAAPGQPQMPAPQAPAPYAPAPQAPATQAPATQAPVTQAAATHPPAAQPPAAMAPAPLPSQAVAPQHAAPQHAAPQPQGPTPQTVPAADPMSPLPLSPGMQQAAPGHAMPSQAMPSQAIPGQAMPGQAMPGQAMPAQAMTGQPMTGAPVGSAAIPMGSAVAAPVAGAATSVAAVPVGQAVQPQDGQSAAPGVSANKSASKEASRRRKQAWAGPLTILVGGLILCLMGGAIYYALNGGRSSVANADGEDPSPPSQGPDGGPANKGAANENNSNENNSSSNSNNSNGTTAGNSGQASENGVVPKESTDTTNTASTNTNPQNPNEQNGTGQGGSDATNNGAAAEVTPSPSSTDKTPNGESGPSVVPIIPIGSEGPDPSTKNGAAGSGATTSGSNGNGAKGNGTNGNGTNGNGTNGNGTNGNNPGAANPAGAKPTEGGTGAESTPGATTAGSPPPANKKELAEFRSAMLAAYDATCLHDFAAAKRSLMEAKSKAKTEPHKEMVARLEEVADYVKQYRAALEKATSELSSGTVFQVGEFTVAVVEAGNDYIKIRAAGQTRHYKLNVLPGNTGLAIADLSLDQLAPSTKVLKGAYLLAHPRIDSKQLDKARELWKKAMQEGADIKHLMPALDDDYAAIK